MAHVFLVPVLGKCAVANDRPCENMSVICAGNTAAEDLTTDPIIPIQDPDSSGCLEIMKKKGDP